MKFLIIILLVVISCGKQNKYSICLNVHKSQETQSCTHEQLVSVDNEYKICNLTNYTITYCFDSAIFRNCDYNKKYQYCNEYIEIQVKEK